MSKLNVMIDGRSYEVELDLYSRDGRELSALVDGKPVRASRKSAEWCRTCGRELVVVLTA